MDLSVLGPTLVAGRHLRRLERKVLTALALEPGRVISTDLLAEACWGDSLPGTWRKQLQALVGGVRRVVGERMIMTSEHGYALSPAVRVDADEFLDLVSMARAKAAVGEPDRAVPLFQRALGLWRGDALADLAEWEPARIPRAQLDQERETVEEELVQAHLDCGEHHSSISIAERLVHERPLREERWRLLALASYRSGRQSEALAALSTARRMLADELGLDPSAALTELEIAILRHSPDLEPPRTARQADGDCPYRGLAAFDLEHADAFHGRDRAVRSACDALDRTGFLVLTGVSGSGKSSLALAGVAARYSAADRGMLVVRPSAIGWVADLENLSTGSTTPALVVIDQLEELFLASAEDIAVACGRIATVLKGSAAVLITVRSDFLDLAAALPFIGGEVARHVQVVPAMTPDELREAIQAPAAAAGLRLEAGLTELILRDATDSAMALPLMSHALVETWARREGSVMTVAGYEAAGGIAGAVARSADGLFAELDQTGRRLCRDTMLRLVERGPEGRPVRRRLPVGAVADDTARREVVAMLTAARLLSTEGDSILITHESIATAWPVLHAWLDEEADDAETRAALGAAAQAWTREGRADDGLYRGARLEGAIAFRERTDPVLTTGESDFLAASIAHERARAEAAARQIHREKAQSRRIRVALAAVSALVILTATAGGAAVFQGASASRQAEEARAAASVARVEALAGQVAALRTSQRDLAALIAAQMYREAPEDARARGALLSVLTAETGFMSTEWIDADSIVGIGIPGGSDVLVVRDGVTVEVHSAADATVRHLVDLPAPSDARAPSLAVRADGAVAAISRTAGSRGANGVVDFIDPASGALRGSPVRLDRWGYALALSPDGHWLASVDEATNSVTVVDLVSGGSRATREFTTAETSSHPAPPASIVFSPSGQLVVADRPGTVTVVDPASLTAVAAFDIGTGATEAAAVTPDGTWVGAGPVAVTAVDLTTDRMLWQQPLAGGKPLSCMALAVSTPLDAVFCGDAYGRIDRRSLSTGLPSPLEYNPQLGPTGAIAVSDSAHLTAIGADAPTLSTWRLDGGSPVARVIARGKVVFDGYEQTGAAILVADRPADAREDGDLDRFSTWDPDADAPGLELPPAFGAGWAGPELLTAWLLETERIEYIAARTGDVIDSDPVPLDALRAWLGPSGARLYHAFKDATVRVVDAHTARFIGRTIHAGGPVQWISASPDDSLIAISRWRSADISTVVLDAETGEALASGLPGATVTQFLPNGDIVAADGGSITVHDGRTLRPLRRLAGGARGEINSLQVSTDGATLLVASNDGTVSLFDVTTGLRLGDPIPTSSPLIIAAFLRPDGEAMVVNVTDGVQVWDLRPSTWLASACRIAGRPMTDVESATYFPDRDAPAQPCADELD